jgi:DNA-binding transcriptional ArsR family regulator
MVTNANRRASATFEAIAHPTRRAILDSLRARELRAGELAARFPVSRPAIARHVRVLRRAGLVRERRQAQARLYSLQPAALAEIDRWLAPYRLFWSARLADLKRTVEQQTEEDR